MPQDGGARRRAGEFLLRVHADLRRDLSALRVDLAAARAGGRPLPHGLAVELGRRCLTACTALRGHHVNEDGGFDTFLRDLPDLAPVLDRLRAEHRQVAAALARIAEAPTDRLDEFETLVGEIEDHFAYEESTLVPALLAEL